MRKHNTAKGPGQIQRKEPDAPAKRTINIEAIWLGDYPGEPHLEKECREAWSDEARKAELRIPQSTPCPAFASRDHRLKVPDPRQYEDFPKWRDSLRNALHFTTWMLDFDIAWHFDSKISKDDVTKDVLKSKSMLLFDASGGQPPLTWLWFLEAVEKGSQEQTVVFVCKPLLREQMRHYPWDKVIFLLVEEGDRFSELALPVQDDNNPTGNTFTARG